jgi:TonB-dependent SusC/RagA subfamily outer membrane receptor
MKNIKLFITCILSFFSIIIYSQTADKNPEVKKPKRALNFPFEKVYLHLDRGYYTSGEDIWFKAYLVNARNNTLFDNSNNLYVELISPESTIIKRITIRVKNGLGMGDFHLADSIAPGNYQVRAYTNWMRNFGEAFFFKKEIHVENMMGAKAPEPKSFQPDKLDLQFFPEGGSLLEDTYSTVGFKTINSTGLGCNVKGKIISSAGDTIVSFESSHLGMGRFNFVCKKGLTYVAVGKTDQNLPFKVDLPQALKTGYCIKVSEMDSFIRVSIKTNQATLTQMPDKNLYVVGSKQGKLYITAKTKVKDQTTMVIIPKKKFAAGINRITLVDTTGKAYCERLYYITQAPRYYISIQPDKKTYAPRQIVNLQISVKDPDNKPVMANLSLSAVDGNQVKEAKYKSDIYSYLLLESEIRGNIEQPSYYFDTTIVDRQNALDDLLLTQGWRNFVWNYLADTTLKFENLIEKGITVSGRLRRLLINKPIANANISMLLFGEKSSLYLSETDSLGKYYFDGLNFTGQKKVIISATNKNHRNQGWLSLDSLFGMPPKTNFKWTFKPDEKTKELIDFKQEADKKYDILKKYHLTDTIDLSAVVVKANKPVNSKKDDHFRMYGSADYTIKVTDDLIAYNDIFQLLQGRVAGLMISGVYPDISISLRGQSGYPLFLLDGMPVGIDEVASLPMSDIDVVDVLKDGASLAMFGSRGGSGVISIFTKKGFAGADKPIFYSINQTINGYYQPRIFYAPKYTAPKTDYEKPDLRTTLYWEPNVNTDSNGNAFVSFFNPDNKSTININLEGISENGVPLVEKTTYNVK